MRLECLFLPARPAGVLLSLVLWVCTPASGAAEVYHDRLIDPDSAGEFAADTRDMEDSEPEGRRFYSVEYQHYRQDYYDTSSENGVLF